MLRLLSDTPRGGIEQPSALDCSSGAQSSLPTSLKTAWESVKETANVTCRLHDLRHSFCTKLAEAGVPEATMLDMMGHVSPAMLRRYSHIRAKSRRDAITALEQRDFSGVLQEVPKVGDSTIPNSPVTH